MVFPFCLIEIHELLKIKNKKSDQVVVDVCMTQNKLIPIKVSSIEKYALVVKEKK